MTVCIATLADVGKSLVMVCDAMLSGIDFSGDRVAYKLYPLTEAWWVMVAGDDITHIVPVIEEVTLRLAVLTAATNTLAYVERVVVESYQKVRMQHAGDLVLAPIGVTLERFWQDSDLFQGYLTERLASVDLGCQFLVAGFDWAGDGHIFTVENPGIARNHDLAGWASIGNGAMTATSTLLYYSVNYTMELARALYHTCEAKFMSETAPGVGKHTVVKIMNAGTGGKTPSELSEEFIARIREDWDKFGRPRAPKSALDGIGVLLREGGFTPSSK